jgi:hypothetical protein
LKRRFIYAKLGLNSVNSHNLLKLIILKEAIDRKRSEFLQTQNLVIKEKEKKKDKGKIRRKEKRKDNENKTNGRRMKMGMGRRREEQ